MADVDAEHGRLTAEGLTPVMPIADHPWGDRGFAVLGVGQGVGEDRLPLAIQLVGVVQVESEPILGPCPDVLETVEIDLAASPFRTTGRPLFLLLVHM